MPRLDTRDPKAIKPNPNQPRTTSDPDAHGQLVESVRQHGVMQPVGLRPDNVNVWGWRRVLAAIEAGLKEIPVVILDRPMTEGDFVCFSLTENIQRSALTGPDLLLGFENALRLDPALT